MVAAKLLIFLSFLKCKYLLTAALNDCVFLGEEVNDCLYEDGDVVLGGLFPLHYLNRTYFRTYKTKPKPDTYQ